MRIRVRLNGYSDADLLMLHQAGYPLGKNIAKAIRGYVLKEDCPLDPFPTASKEQLIIKPTVVSVTLPDVPEVNDWAVKTAVHKNYRGFIVKTIFRCMSKTPYIDFLYDPDISIETAKSGSESVTREPLKDTISGQFVTPRSDGTESEKKEAENVTPYSDKKDENVTPCSDTVSVTPYSDKNHAITDDISDTDQDDPLDIFSGFVDEW